MCVVVVLLYGLAAGVWCDIAEPCCVSVLCGHHVGSTAADELRPLLLLLLLLHVLLVCTLSLAVLLL